MFIYNNFKYGDSAPAFWADKIKKFPLKKLLII